MWVAALALLTATGRTQSGAPVVPKGAALDSAGYTRLAAPGSIISVFGSNLAAGTAQASELPLPTELGGVSMEIADGVRVEPAPLLYVSPTQINGQVPFSMAGTTVEIRVRNAAGTSSADVLPLAPRAPRVFTATGAGTGDALAVHSDASAVSADSPALPGEELRLYVAGMGEASPDLPATVTVAGKPGTVLSAGLWPGSTGVYQLDFRLPEDLGPGTQDLLVSAGDYESQPGVTLPVGGNAGRSEFYVAPDGTPAGAGTKSEPWDLTTALNQPSAVKPGDIVWLRNGVYGDGRSAFESKLTGTPDRPIIVRQFPGERATINGGIAVFGANCWYWGFEVTNTTPDRTDQRNAPDGIDSYAADTRFINLVIHDTNQGIGLWEKAENAEAYGCIIYHNGFQGSDRGHGHGIYTQNLTGTKHIGDNIIFSQFGFGLHAYGSANAHVEGYRVDGNIAFNNGDISGARVDNILFAGGQTMKRIRIEDNYAYHTPSEDVGYSRLGWTWSPVNEDVSASRNYWMGGFSAIELWNWNNVTFTNNTAYAAKSFVAILSLLESQKTSGYAWDNNTYYGTGLFRLSGQNRNWEAWKASTGLDANSRQISGAPTGIWTFVRPNRYEPGRAHIVIYNWDHKDSVAVDLSRALKSGDRFEVRDAQNFFGPAVVTGTYSGAPVVLPMTGLKRVDPVGTVPSPPKHTAPEFGSFVLLPR